MPTNPIVLLKDDVSMPEFLPRHKVGRQVVVAGEKSFRFHKSHTHAEKLENTLPVGGGGWDPSHRPTWPLSIWGGWCGLQKAPCRLRQGAGVGLYEAGLKCPGPFEVRHH